MKQKSAKERLWWAQFNALEMGSGWDDTDIHKPQIMIEDVYGDSHPGSVHLHQLARPRSAFLKRAVSLPTTIPPMSATAARRDTTA